MTESAPLATRRKLGRYEIVAEIARGGMGTVYLARLEGVAGFQRLFALKLLHRHLAEEEQFVSMLLDEARLAARLHHPNAVGIVDVSDSPLGYYLVMDYVDGFSLDRLIARLKEPERRARIGIRVFLDTCAGLDAAHRLTDDDGEPLNIVHRDVSPQNILVGTDGAGRITDFGVARAAARITASRPGMLKGKPCYMAPEQAKGADDLDARADVFALGIVLWELLTGRALFRSKEGGAAVTLMKVCNQPVEPPSTVYEALPPAIDEVCMKALERDKDARFASARDFAVALEKAAGETGWLPSRHDVADAVRELFVDEIAKRKTAIRTHVDSLGEGTEPMVASDIYDVPRLQAKPGVVVTRAEKSGPWHETPVASGVRASEAATVAATPLSTAATAVTPGGRPWILAVGMGLVGVGLLMLAVVLWPPSAEGTQSDESEVTAAAAEAAAAEAEAAEAAEEAETQAAEAAEARAAAEAEAAAETQAEAEAAAAEAEAAEAAEAEAAEAQAAAQMRRTPMSTMTSMASGPTLETNPYLR